MLYGLWPVLGLSQASACFAAELAQEMLMPSPTSLEAKSEPVTTETLRSYNAERTQTFIYKFSKASIFRSYTIHAYKFWGAMRMFLRPSLENQIHYSI